MGIVDGQVAVFTGAEQDVSAQLQASLAAEGASVVVSDIIPM